MTRFGRALNFNVAAVAAAISLLASCLRMDTSEILAVVGDREITKQELTQELELARRQGQVEVDPETLLSEMVEREVLTQNAVLSGYMEDPVVREQISNVLIARLKELQLASELEKVEVSDAELLEAYEKEKLTLIRPEQVRLAILYSAFTPEDKRGGGEELRLRMQSAAELARQQDNRNDKGEVTGFGALAIQYSEDQESRYRGGEIGWVERARFPGRIEGEVVEAGMALKEPGMLSDVIMTAKGCYVVKLLERREATALPYEQVAPALEAKLLAYKKQQVEARFQTSLREKVRVESYPEKLAGMASSTSVNTPVPPSVP